MNKIKTIREFFRGKKTFIIGVLMVILGLLTNDSKMSLDGLGFITLRAGMHN